MRSLGVLREVGWEGVDWQHTFSAFNPGDLKIYQISSEVMKYYMVYDSCTSFVTLVIKAVLPG